MKVSYSWLKELVDFDWSPEELAEKLTSVGLPAESIERLSFGLEDVVVGEIIRVVKHPQADKLVVCDVGIGKQVLQIVCGASNVKEKQKVPVALPQALLPNGIKIEKAILRGVESFGMLCSEKELGLGEDESGIMILNPNLKAGLSLAAALEIEDFVLDVELTPNRADCLSIMGIAREIQALTGNKIEIPNFRLKEIEKSAKGEVEVIIEDKNACPRYVARIIEDVQIKESPLWLKRKVEASGIRSINNVVDVTNLVMIETGQPLHAFDFDLFFQNKVVVRKAGPKEKFITLDGQERELSDQILLITDGKKALAIAGIMGGEESEVRAETKRILLESAYFHATTIRRGRIHLGLNTESSQRFEKGIDPNNVAFSADRAAELIQRLAGGKILKGNVDNYPEPIKPPRISLRTERVNKILGTNLKKQEIIKILKGLDIKVKIDKVLKTEIPTFRQDLTREIDLIEEVARIYGYEKVDVSLRAGGNLITRISPEDKLLRKVREVLVNRGFFEIVTNSFVDPKILEKFSKENPVTILNPLSEDLSALRTTLIPNVLNVIAHNKKRREEDIRVFEAGKVFIKTGQNLPTEKEVLCLALSGKRAWRDWSGKKEKIDFFDLKGVIDELSLSFAGRKTDLSLMENSIFENNFSFQINFDSVILGQYGKINSELLGMVDLKEDVYLAQVEIDKFFSIQPEGKKFTALPKFPPADRDIAIIVDNSIKEREVEKEIIGLAGEILEEVWLFDLYQGQQIPPGKKSLAFSLRYRSAEKTLTEAEVQEVQQKIISVLQDKFQAVLRE
jgi:phenylalanyl-tRNA synthetase beta chain